MKKFLPILVLAGLPAAARADDFFEARVRPLLVEKCVGCHGPEKQKGGLRLDTRAGWAKGGDSGPAVVPGKPDESVLVKAIGYRDKDLRMPPDKPLPAREAEVLIEWVRRGAPDPRTGAASPLADWETVFRQRLDWWSLKPPAAAKIPEVAETAWAADPIDRFIRTELDWAKLQPAPPAEPEILLRRLSFVLTGLPPSPELRERFLTEARSDKSKAYERLVDELLASPHFGERFTRHWMDVVRYTDTYGYEWDVPAKGSHEYRDYLIRAFNGDLPFDQFVREQLAGDLLPQPRVNAALGINESLIGPMFYHLGDHRHGSSRDFNGVHQEMVDNKIDALSKAFLGLTVACARCHDHKLEAISQRDYYALAAVLMTPRWAARVVDAPGKNDAAIRRLRELRDAIRAELAATWRKTIADPEWAAGWAARALPKGSAPVAIEQIDYPLARLAGAADPAATWAALVAEWRTTRAERRKHNEQFKPLADVSKPDLPAGWVAEGDGFTNGFVTDCTPLIALEGDAVVARLLPAGYHTHALSSKLPGALLSPPDGQVPGKHFSIELAGGQFGGYLEVDENAFLGEEVTFFNEPRPRWKTFTDKPPIVGGSRVAYTFATAGLNPNFPPRTGKAPGLPDADFGYDKRSWISVTGIVSHDQPGTPLDTLDAFEALYDGTKPANRTDVEHRVARWLSDAVVRWCDGKSRSGDRAILDWLLTNRILPNAAAPGSRLADLVAEYRHVEAAIPFPRTAMSMDERQTAKAAYPLNVRGNVDATGDLLRPDFLRMFAGRNGVAAASGSGRLELAESLIRPDHPLTARVYVNRLWQWVIGTGLVTTPDDFGHLGERPSHPELHDYLADELLRDGWSTKRLVRRLVLSQTFRESGVVSPEARTRDPDNRLRHHYPTRRLEAEELRDAMLAVSGRLDQRLYGRPVLPPRTAEDPMKRLYAGPLDGDGRRSVYLQMSIMEPPKFLTAFNLPDLRLPAGRRDGTNVPAQALILLNDPFVHAMAAHWGRQFATAPHASAEDRVRSLFVAALAREPTPAEVARWTSAARQFATPGSDLMTDAAAWGRVAHALFNAKEFLYYR